MNPYELRQTYVYLHHHTFNIKYYALLVQGLKYEVNVNDSLNVALGYP